MVKWKVGTVYIAFLSKHLCIFLNCQPVPQPPPVGENILLNWYYLMDSLFPTYQKWNLPTSPPIWLCFLPPIWLCFLQEWPKQTSLNLWCLKLYPRSGPHLNSFYDHVGTPFFPPSKLLLIPLLTHSYWSPNNVPSSLCYKTPSKHTFSRTCHLWSCPRPLSGLQLST